MRVLVPEIWRREAGQNLVEYGLLLGLLVLGSIALLSSSGAPVSSIWTSANLALQGQPSGSTGATATPASGGSTSTSGSGSGSGYAYGDHRDDDH